MGKSQESVRGEVFRDEARTARALGDRALHDIDAMLLEQEAFREGLHGSDEEIDAQIYEHDHSTAQSSPNFYL